MKYNFLLTLFFVGFLISCNTETKAPPAPDQLSENTPTKTQDKKKALFVCTSVDKVNGKKNGTFLSEITVPFILLEEKGLEIDLVSPKGGPIPIYYKFDTTAIIARALASDYYQKKIQNSLTPQQVNPNDYQVVILPGGYGQFWDLHEDASINQLVAQTYEHGAILGALGHGTAALVNLTLSNGDPLVKGKTLTCFPSWFEKEFMLEADYGKLLPFDMEVELEKRGANLQRVDKETRSNGQIVDAQHRLITASFATGGEFISSEVLKMLYTGQPH